jgi:formamidopyrimidine-DNA glycosylase
MTTIATYTKLKSGNWGIRVQSEEVEAGNEIPVTKKSGETKIEVVERVLWTGNGISLCAIRQSQYSCSSSRSSYTRRRGGCRDCGGPIVDARHHRAMHGYCGACAFDEFDC